MRLEIIKNDNDVNDGSFFFFKKIIQSTIGTRTAAINDEHVPGTLAVIYRLRPIKINQPAIYRRVTRVSRDNDGGIQMDV